MKIAGIVAEYNPFHSGHGWHITETRRMGATHVVVVMSGCYVQRGEPALWDKWTRTRAALLGGADLVVELPLPYAAATAQRFAMGAVSLLEALGPVELLSFGSECGEVSLLDRVARALLDPEVAATIPDLLATGVPYAAARQRVVEMLYGRPVSDLLGQPNNILGIEYLVCLHRLDSGMVPLTVPRQGTAHDSTELGKYASASALRRLMSAPEGLEQAMGYLPEVCRDLYRNAWERGECALGEQLERPMLARLRQLSLAELRALPDISEGLEHRIREAIRGAATVDGLLEKAKTKRYSHARLRRILLSGWLGIPAGLSAEPPPYLRLLGMNGRGREILAAAGPRASLPMSQSAARLGELGERQRQYIELEARADDLYGIITGTVQPCSRDYTNSIIVVE